MPFILEHHMNDVVTGNPPKKPIFPKVENFSKIEAGDFL